MSIPAVTVHTIIRNQQEAREQGTHTAGIAPSRPVAKTKKKHGRRRKETYFKTNWSKVFRLQWF